MKLPKIKTLSIETDSNNILVNINESAVVKYKLTENCEDKLNIAQDLIDNRAFATLFLFMNENFNLVADSYKDADNFYRSCDKLLNENIKIVEELGKPLTEICGYPIFESDKGILRGAGKKKVKEYFREWEEVDLADIDLDYVKNLKYETEIKDMAKCPKCKYIFYIPDNKLTVKEKGTEAYSTLNEPYNERTVTYEVESLECPHCHFIDAEEEFPKAWVSDIEDAPNAEDLVPGITTLEEDAEGTQCDDIAGKTDQDLGVIDAEPKKKHYDILLGNYNRNEIDESVSFKGFLKNSKGQYQRGNYILVKEGDKYLAIHKDKLEESHKLNKEEK